MKKLTNNKIVPMLRFPEFRDAGEWEKTQLGKLGELIPGLTYSPEDVREKGLLVLRSSNVQNGEIVLDDCVYVTPESKGANLSKSNDILICVRNGSKNLIGKNALIPEGMPLCTHGAFMTVFRSKSAKFVYQLFQTESYNKQVSSDLGATINSINNTHLVKYKFYVPKPPEQQKIADCLTSIDSLISTQSQKLDTLKVHKKGLMQQLFPAQGETVPRLRFAEFRDGGEWEETTLSQCLLKHPEYGINAPAVPYTPNLPTYLRITDISEEGYFIRNQMVSVDREVSEDNYLNEGDIVLARTGASVGKSYKYKIEDGRLVFAGFLIRVKPDEKKINSELLFQFLSTDQYWRWVIYISTRSGQPGINGNEYASMPLPLPPTLKEQQKIASCLTSLDELITAYNQKIKTLKAHKKGLMQQLFPNINDNNLKNEST